MMQIIDTAIDLMRRKHKKGEFYYWILYYAYLSPQQCENAGAILQLLETKGISISLRTYYVHRDEAIEVLSSIFVGLHFPGLRENHQFADTRLTNTTFAINLRCKAVPTTLFCIEQKTPALVRRGRYKEKPRFCFTQNAE